MRSPARLFALSGVIGAATALVLDLWFRREMRQEGYSPGAFAAVAVVAILLGLSVAARGMPDDRRSLASIAALLGAALAADVLAVHVHYTICSLVAATALLSCVVVQRLSTANER